MFVHTLCIAPDSLCRPSVPSSLQFDEETYDRGLQQRLLKQNRNMCEEIKGSIETKRIPLLLDVQCSIIWCVQKAKSSNDKYASLQLNNKTYAYINCKGLTVTNRFFPTSNLQLVMNTIHAYFLIHTYNTIYFTTFGFVQPKKSVTPCQYFG